DGDAVYNSVQLIRADGTRLANYRKTHLFGCFEQEHFTPGGRPVVQAELNGLTVGLVICYDVEFPENVRAHALAGTDLLLVPTALMHPFQFVAESRVPVRAFENQMYVAYANRVGTEGDLECAGLSVLAGPDGVARARAGRAEELVCADADPEFLAASRAANPYLRDRRPELYGPLTCPPRPTPAVPRSHPCKTTARHDVYGAQRQRAGQRAAAADRQVRPGPPGRIRRLPRSPSPARAA